jgi:hypothetical protein
MITVAMVKSRPGYNAAYVNRLAAAVHDNLSVPHRMVCLTDDPAGIKCSTKKLPAMVAGHGWWAKLALHRPGVLSGKVLYLDLDTLIVGNLDFLDGYEGEFACLRDFYRPDGYGSGVMLWNAAQPQIWNDWKGSDHPLGDQGWLEQKVPGADRLQDLYPGKFVSFKVHCEQALPENAAVLCFHGYPKQEDFSDDHPFAKLWRAYG